MERYGLVPVRTSSGRDICGVLGRRYFTILVDNIMLVLDSEKEEAWEKFKLSFKYPADDEQRLKCRALQKMGNYLKNWKTKLVSEYVLNPYQPTPYSKWLWITETVWAEFVAAK